MSQAVDDPKEGEVAARYKELAGTREPFLRRAKECAAVTIPSLLPRHEESSHLKLPTPHQSIGAAGVNNLASKLCLALFPPNGKFFRLIITSFDVDNLVLQAAQEEAQQSGEDPAEVAAQLRTEVENEIQENLVRVERAVVQEYEAKGNRATDFEAMKHLVALGNVLRFCPLKKNDKPRIYALNQYAVRRDPDGTPLEIITKEGVAPATVPVEVREACKIPPDGDKEIKRVYDLYTRVRRSEDKRGKPRWEEYQELNGIEVPGSRGYYKIDKCPWLPLRWSKIDGEDYGRGHVEDYLGDLISLNGLRKAITDGAAGAARLLFMMNPAGVTKARDIAETPNGGIITGNPQDVGVLRLEKAHDFGFALQTSQEVKRDLGQAFLLTTSIQRNGDRVTAEEFRRLAKELEEALGGNYSTLALEYQQPLVELTMFGMQKQRRLPTLPDEVQPTILTGIQALGRNADLERMMMFFDVIGKLPIPQEELALTIKAQGAYRQVAAALDIETRGLLNSPQEIEQMKQQQQQQVMTQAAAAPIAQAMAGQAAQAGQAPL